jgi:hypothetical protein
VAKHIAILIHRHGSFDRNTYLLSEVAEVWRQSGLQITVLPGPQPNVTADLAILHVDLTVAPQDHLDFVDQFPRAINAGVADISKRAISSNLVRQGDGFEGPVILKSDRNSGGYREACLAAKGLMPPCTVFPPARYTIFRSVAAVPPVIWQRPDLVVERFLPERSGEFFCLRTWVFLGDKETHSLSFSKKPIVKSSNVVQRQPLGEVPDELRQIRQRLKFDYGKFDYCLVDGRPVLYDANRTPTLGRFTPEEFMPRIRLLAEGIHSFL